MRDDEGAKQNQLNYFYLALKSYLKTGLKSVRGLVQI